MFELSRLTFLAAVHRHGSVVRAAEALGYTASAVSQQVAKLEREVGAGLLEPAGRGVVLTDAALVLVDAAEAVGVARETAEARLEALAQELVGSLRVACFPSAVRGLVAPALGALAHDAPGLRTSLRELAPEPGLEAVVTGRVDVAVVHDWTTDRTTFPRQVESTHLLDDRVDLVVPASSPLGGRDAIEIADAIGEPWVTDVSDSITTRWIVDLLAAAGERDRLRFRGRGVRLAARPHRRRPLRRDPAATRPAHPAPVGPGADADR